MTLFNMPMLRTLMPQEMLGIRRFFASQSPSSSIRARRWTQQENDQLLQLHKIKKPITEMSKILNRPRSSIDTRLKRLGLKVPKIQPVYTAEEKTKLVRLKDEGNDWDQISRHFPDRKIRSLQVTYYSLKSGELAMNTGPRRRYSKEEDKLLFELKDKTISSIPWTEIALKLGTGRKRNSLQKRYSHLVPNKALRTQAVDPRHWTSVQEQDLLRYISSGLPRSDIAAKLGKSYESVHSKMTWLKRNAGLVERFETRPRPKHWSREEMQELSTIKPSSDNWKELATRLGRTFTAVRAKWRAVKREERRSSE